VNRYIQNILQHPRFAETGQGNVEHLWEQTAKFIYALFFTHPVNTCQPSHVEPLLGLYRGTMSEVDRTLLSIFQLFETQRAASVASLFSRWTASPGHNTAGTALDALRSLDSVTMFRTCLSFPRARTMSGHSRTSRDDIERHIYDPVFATLLFSQTIRRHPPETALVWVEVFRTNVVSLMICALSAKYAEVRELALNQIATLRTVLKVRLCLFMCSP
jgi:nucleolar pre-ribosomal-associated protein 1